jgi:hypothetical protein
LCTATAAMISASREAEMNGSKMSKPKLTRDQKQALADYEYRLRQEDRYFGSVFVTPQGQREIEAKTKAAYDRCVSLGMTHEHGL